MADAIDREIRALMASMATMLSNAAFRVSRYKAIKMAALLLIYAKALKEKK